MDGIINVNKPLGITSHDVVYRLRKLLNIKKIGHTGTLDPDAGGVLPMCIGKGTKLAELLTATDKQYLAEMTLGAITDTQDKSGEILESFEVNVSEEEIKEAVKTFIGEISQIPPMYSAIKIDGKKLYELAREGKTIERQARTVLIKNIEIKEIKLEQNTVTMLVDCSKGTYIRVLCENIAEKLETVGYMNSLNRIIVDKFSIDKAIDFETLEKNKNNDDFLNNNLIMMEEVFANLPKLNLNSRKLELFLNGVMLTFKNQDGLYNIYDEKNNYIGTGTIKS